MSRDSKWAVRWLVEVCCMPCHKIHGIKQQVSCQMTFQCLSHAVSHRTCHDSKWAVKWLVKVRHMSWDSKWAVRWLVNVCHLEHVMRASELSDDMPMFVTCHELICQGMSHVTQHMPWESKWAVRYDVNVCRMIAHVTRLLTYKQKTTQSSYVCKEREWSQMFHVFNKHKQY